MVKLLDKIKIKKEGIRLLGVKLSKFSSDNTPKQLNLLGDREEKLEQLTQSLDKIRDKFGSKFITRASLLK